jgi:hypothetical protein
MNSITYRHPVLTLDSKSAVQKKKKKERKKNTHRVFFSLFNMAQKQGRQQTLLNYFSKQPKTQHRLAFILSSLNMILEIDILHLK